MDHEGLVVSRIDFGLQELSLPKCLSQRLHLDAVAWARTGAGAWISYSLSCSLITVPNNSLTDLAKVIAQGLPGPISGLRPHIDALFGDRYQKRYHAPTAVRDAYALADGDEGVPYAGIINRDNPPSGPYGGTSVVWFPTRDSGSLIDFVIGTRGLAPDEGILTRPGHKRRVTALRRYLARLGIETWVKHDPSALGAAVP